MRAVRIHKFGGGPQDLVYEEDVMRPHPKEGHVIGTASAHNSSFLKDLGVNDVIDYKKTSFEDRVHDVDVVFDTVGGKTLERS